MGRISVNSPLPHLTDTEEKANVTCDQSNGSFGHEQADGCVCVNLHMGPASEDQKKTSETVKALGMK